VHQLPWPVTTPPRARADGAARARMTDAQRDRLWQLCAVYNVPFREDDYFLWTEKSGGVGAGWVEGWVGGRDGAGLTRRKTMYVGMDPEGRWSSHP